MFKNKPAKPLNRTETDDKEDKKTVKAVGKTQGTKRLSSEEFRKVYDDLWEEGPKIQYQSPDAWRKPGENGK